MKTGYTKKDGQYVFVWVLGFNTSGSVALVTNDEMGLEETGAKYRFIVDDFNLFLNPKEGE